MQHDIEADVRGVAGPHLPQQSEIFTTRRVSVALRFCLREHLAAQLQKRLGRR